MTEIPIRKAVILAAGKGTRMGSLTEQMPKPMLPIQGKPLLQVILERLASAGFAEAFVVIGYRNELVTDYFADWPTRLEFCVQDPVNGTGSATRLARDFVANGSFLLTYADILCDPSEYTRCASILDQNRSAAGVLAVKAVDDPWRGAAVYDENGVISQIIEKPPKGTSTTHWNSAGFYAFRPVLFPYLDRIQPSSRNEYELTTALDLMLQDAVELRVSPIEGDWRDVGTPEDLNSVNPDRA